MGRRCFFIGHRDAPNHIQPELEHLVKFCTEKLDVTHFMVGHYGNFDRLAATAVKKHKQAVPAITLELLIPFHPAERPIDIPEGFDGTYYPEGQEAVPHKLAIVKANQVAVKYSDILIAYVTGPGNSRSLIEFARKQGVFVLNIADLECWKETNP